MSVIQVEDLVSYQLRTGYLNEVADGVGERLITLNEAFLNSPAFKAAGWRPNPSLIKRTHSPPIPTAIASEYFQAPRSAGLTLEDEADDGGASGMLATGGADTTGPGLATKRRRRREQMEEDDSSDLSDESDDDADQRAAQQIKFAKMPVRSRAGSSPIQTSGLRQGSTASSVSATNVGVGAAANGGGVVASPRAPGARRGSQSALEVVKERHRRDTVTSSEVSSENEFDASGFHKQREAARAAAKAAKLQVRLNTDPATLGIKRVDTDLLPEEEDSDASDMSGAFVESIDSASILDGVDNPLNAAAASPGQQVVGNPPRELLRQSTIRRSQAPPMQPNVLAALPPPRPMSTVRPISMIQPKSLLSAALNAKKTKPAMPFEGFASLSGQGDPNPISLRIYAPFSRAPSRPFEVLIRRKVNEGQGPARSVTVADLIGLSLWRYNEDKIEPALPSDRLNINWWTLRMVEEDGEVDDDFPPLERKKALTSFTTANNRAAGRMRSNSKTHDNFALAKASQTEFSENQTITPQSDEREATEEAGEGDGDVTPRNTPGRNLNSFLAPAAGTGAGAAPADTARLNPVLWTTYRSHATALADTPQAPTTAPPTTRGQQKLLRIHIHSSDVAPGQMVTLDVTTDTYLAEVLDLVCRKRQLDKANHVLKLPGSGAVVLLDRAVSSIGNVTDLELYRRRFATDGPLSITGSPSSSSPKILPAIDGGLGSGSGSLGGGGFGGGVGQVGAARRSKRREFMGPHPLAQEALKVEELGGSANYKKYTVWRKQPMRIVGMSERILAIDGEYIHITPASGGKALMDGAGKTTTVHFSNVVGCKVSRKHPTNFKLVVYKATESKRYDFEARSADEANDIVTELTKGISPYRDV